MNKTQEPEFLGELILKPFNKEEFEKAEEKGEVVHLK